MGQEEELNRKAALLSMPKLLTYVADFTMIQYSVLWLHKRSNGAKNYANDLFGLKFIDIGRVEEFKTKATFQTGHNNLSG